MPPHNGNITPTQPHHACTTLDFSWMPLKVHAPPRQPPRHSRHARCARIILTWALAWKWRPRHPPRTNSCPSIDFMDPNHLCSPPPPSVRRQLPPLTAKRLGMPTPDDITVDPAELGVWIDPLGESPPQPTRSDAVRANATHLMKLLQVATPPPLSISSTCLPLSDQVRPALPPPVWRSIYRFDCVIHPR